jgi:hypothetical protein
MREGDLKMDFDLGESGEGGTGAAVGGIDNCVCTERRGFGFDPFKGQGNRRAFW